LPENLSKNGIQITSVGGIATGVRLTLVALPKYGELRPEQIWFPLSINNSYRQDWREGIPKYNCRPARIAESISQLKPDN